MTLAGELLIGSCSWKYPCWFGLVYSQPHGINYLKEYSRRYRTVEIDQWFWSLFDNSTIVLPESETVCEYASSGWRYAVEIRNPDYLTETYFAVLRENAASHAFCEGYFLPAAAETYRRFGSLLWGPVLFRLQARDRTAMDRASGKQWNRIVEPRDETIADLAAAVVDAITVGRRTIVSVNNHFEGSAPLTIDKFRTEVARITGSGGR
jgi:uncharacterized protein YecE (DUF72 family)